MKVYVHYDHSGAIHSVTSVDAPADGVPMLTPSQVFSSLRSRERALG